jgi:hypothetical protein
VIPRRPVKKLSLRSHPRSPLNLPVSPNFLLAMTPLNEPRNISVELKQTPRERLLKRRDVKLMRGSKFRNLSVDVKLLPGKRELLK